ncbi:MAG TPA: AMP nucleosidase [Acidimicrobiia bacterium]|nr:AMP nucleosidase [Acidimicrobiia bacterium]
MIERAIDGSEVEPASIGAAVNELCDALEAIDADGWYPAIEVVRPWSRHNPRITGEFARPRTIRWYLERELGALLELGARVTVRASRRETSLDDPALLRALDEVAWEMRAKKLFLFAPERMALSMERLAHYCGTPAESFQRYVLFTNYAMHVEEFRETFADAEGPNRPDVQMPAWHYRRPDHDGVTIIDIGVGPSNAKTVTDHIAVLRPDAMLMIGHCAGLRNHQDIGDYVLATSYLRDDRILDHALPTTIPVIPNHRLNAYLLDALDTHRARYRIGTVLTTANRNWELEIEAMEHTFEQSRAIAVDMESATIAANGFRYRIPSATLLAISDKPLHGSPKLAEQAKSFYDTSRRAHLEITLECIDHVRREHPAGIPNADIRSPGEPLFGAPAVDPRDGTTTPDR